MSVDAVVNGLCTSKDVCYYGAACDGVTDDTAAIAAAIAAVRGPINLPVGTCVIRPPVGTGTSALTLPSNTVFVGKGKGQSILRCKPFSTSLFSRCISIATASANVTLESFTLKLDATDITPGGTAFLTNIVATTQRLVFRDVELDGSTIVYANATISHDAYGVRVPSGASINYWQMIEIELHHMLFGIIQTNSATTSLNDISVTNSWFYLNAADDLSFNAPSGNGSNYIIANNIMENNLGYLFNRPALAIGYAGPGLGLVITGNIIKGPYVFNGIHVEEGTGEFVISDNVLIVQGAGITVQWNNITYASGRTPYHGVIANNVVHSSGNDIATSTTGIVVIYDRYFDAGFPEGFEISIDDNMVSGPFQQGIVMATRPWHGNSLKDNSVDGAATCFFLAGGSYLLDNNFAANCTIGISGTNVKARSQAFFNNSVPYAVSKELSIESSVFEFPPITITGGVTTYTNVLPANTSTLFSMSATAFASAQALSTDNSLIQWTQLVFDGTTLFEGTKMSLQAGALATAVRVSGGWLQVGVFCATSRSNVSLEINFRGQYGFNSLAAATSTTGQPYLPADVTISNTLTVSGNGLITAKHYVTTAGTPTCTVLGPAGTGATCSVTGTDSGFVAALNTGTGVTSGATSLRIDYARPFASRPYGISSSVASGTTVTELLTTSPCWTVGPGDVNGFWMFNSCALADSKTYERTFTVMG